MWSVFICIFVALAPSLAEPYFRNDYIFKQETSSFYKLHTANSTWSDARQTCKLEGAELFVPENQEDAEVGVALMKTNKIFQIYIGLQDILAEGDFTTSEGVSSDELYDKWSTGEPSGEDGKDCAVLKDDALLNDQTCYLLYPFICKIAQDSVVVEPKCIPPAPPTTQQTTTVSGKPYFRDDYIYKPETQSFYKLHTHATWSDATLRCKLEGAELYVPVNQKDAEIGVELMNTRGYHYVYVDLRDSLVEGDFVTSKGLSIDEIFNKWEIGEPNNQGGEDCVIFKKEFEYSDQYCDKMWPSICKKTQESNATPMQTPPPPAADPSKPQFRDDYIYKPQTRSFYKIHEAASLTSARSSCEYEGAELYVPVNQADADIGVELMKTKGYDFVYIDLGDALVEGEYVTSKGVSIDEVFNKWRLGEPNDHEHAEDCATLVSTGNLNDVWCYASWPYICKKTLDPADPSKPYFRDDYVYKPETLSYYKIHARKTWSDARQTCKVEGAELFVPVNEIDAEIGVKLMKSKGYDRVFVDLSDTLDEGEFVTSQGVSINKVFNEWDDGEPNDADGGEDCAILFKHKTLNDDDCDKQHPFICKKTQDSLGTTQPTPPPVADPSKPYFRADYVYKQETQSFYKLHSHETWSEAKQTCNSEGAKLFVPENQKDAEIGVALMKSNQFSQIYVDLQDVSVEGEFTTSEGVSSTDLYDKWSTGEPSGEDGEDCAVLKEDALLNDQSCALLYPFICKKAKDEVVTYPECTTPAPPTTTQRTTTQTSKTTTSVPSNPSTTSVPSNPSTTPAPSKPFYRKDYIYKPETQSFYKLHSRKTWSDARQRCKLEGAELYVPVNQTDADIGVELMKTRDYPFVFVDLQDILVEGEFTTSQGVSVNDLFNVWGAGEPNGANGGEDCAVLYKEARLNDESCIKKWPFICKKAQEAVVWNTECDLPYPGFKYHEFENSEKCYKFNLIPMTWDEANTACRTQESYLAVINSNAEANHLVKMTKMATKGVAQGDNPKGEVHLGFHKKFSLGFETLQGEPLATAGYGEWNHNLPGDINSVEKCGSMTYNGTLSAIACDAKAYFICEHDVIQTDLDSFD